MESGILCPVLHVQVILVQLLKTDLFRRGKTRMCISSIHFFFGRLRSLPSSLGMRRGKKEERPTKEEVDGGNTRDVRDESGGVERCGGGSGRVEKTDHVNRQNSTS